MDNRIVLFDSYIDGNLNVDEKQVFDTRLKTDKAFALEFRIYLFTLHGVCREAEQNDVEFGQAMKNISKQDLLCILGRHQRHNIKPIFYLRERFAWIASAVAVVAIGLVSVLSIHRAYMERLDDIIVAYNYIPDANRGWESITSDEISSLEKAYHSAPSDDIQAQQDAGMCLAMGYLKLHNRKKAIEILSELSERFSEDEEFDAQCQIILNQLR